jgi:hypothetical protein
MHLSRSFPRKLISVALLACAAVFAPAAALVATVPRHARRGRRDPVHDRRARRLAEHRGQRYGWQRLLPPRSHQRLRAHLHRLRQSGGLGSQPRRPPARSAAHYHATTPPALVALPDGESASDQVQNLDAGLLPASRYAKAFAAGLQVYPPDQTTSKVAPHTRSSPVRVRARSTSRSSRRGFATIPEARADGTGARAGRGSGIAARGRASPYRRRHGADGFVTPVATPCSPSYR